MYQLKEEPVKDNQFDKQPKEKQLIEKFKAFKSFPWRYDGKSNSSNWNVQKLFSEKLLEKQNRYTKRTN